MPTQPLDSPPDPRATAFAAFVALLQGSERLRRHRIVWRLPEDRQFDDPPPERNLTIRLTPDNGPVSLAAVNYPYVESYRLPLDVSVEVFVPGTLWANVEAILGDINAAVLTIGMTAQEREAFRARLATAGISALRPGMGMARAAAPDKATPGMAAGTFLLEIYS